MTVCFLKAPQKGLIVWFTDSKMGVVYDRCPKNARTEEDLMLQCKRYRLYQLVSYQRSILNFNDFNRQWFQKSSEISFGSMLSIPAFHTPCPFAMNASRWTVLGRRCLPHWTRGAALCLGAAVAAPLVLGAATPRRPGVRASGVSSRRSKRGRVGVWRRRMEAVACIMRPA